MANNFVFNKENYKWMIIGIVLVLVGFILMVGGSTDDPNTFNKDAVFSHRRITLAPFLVIAGYAVVIYAIMKKSASNQVEESTPGSVNDE